MTPEDTMRIAFFVHIVQIVLVKALEILKLNGTKIKLKILVVYYIKTHQLSPNNQMNSDTLDRHSVA